MNKIDFKQTGGFPLDTNVLDFMQQAYMLFCVLGEIAGNLTILQGCTRSGSKVSDGVVYVNGEVLQFKGGTAGSKVVIRSIKTPLQFEDGNSKDVEEVRYATFGVGSHSYSFASFKRIDNIQQLMHKLATHTHVWSKITNRPTTFPPATHTHAWSKITGRPTTFPPATHTHAWSKITSKPTTFPPSTHTHAWSKITGRPTTFPPSTHTHSYNDLRDKPSLGKGQIVVAGKVGYSPRRIIKTLAGRFWIASCPVNSRQRAWHKITHNLGHTDYIVTGMIVKGHHAGENTKFSCFAHYSDYCYISTSDDNSPNAADFSFQITSFR